MLHGLPAPDSTRSQSYAQPHVAAPRAVRRYRRYSTEVKHSAVSQYLQGQGTLRSIAERLDVDHSLVWRWANEHRRLADAPEGAPWPMPSRYQRHSPEKKMQVVRAYLQGEGTLRDIGARFRVNHTLVRRWALDHQAGRLVLLHTTLAAIDAAALVQPSLPTATKFSEPQAAACA
jgi:transposase-like protein